MHMGGGVPFRMALRCTLVRDDSYLYHAVE